MESISIGPHRSVWTSSRCCLAWLEDCGKLVLLCFPSMQDSHGGIFSLNIGRPLTMEFFWRRLRLWNGRFPNLVCQTIVSFRMDALCAYGWIRFAVLKVRGNILFWVMWISEIIFLLGIMSYILQDAPSKSTLHPCSMSCPTLSKLCFRSGTW